MTEVRWSRPRKIWAASCDVSKFHREVWIAGSWCGKGCHNGLKKACARITRNIRQENPDFHLFHVSVSIVSIASKQYQYLMHVINMINVLRLRLSCASFALGQGLEKVQEEICSRVQAGETDLPVPGQRACLDLGR